MDYFDKLLQETLTGTRQLPRENMENYVNQYVFEKVFKKHSWSKIIYAWSFVWSGAVRALIAVQKHPRANDNFALTYTHLICQEYKIGW